MTKEQAFDFIAEQVTNWLNPNECRTEDDMRNGIAYIQGVVETVNRDLQLKKEAEMHRSMYER